MFTLYLVERPKSIKIEEFFKIIFQISNKLNKTLKLRISKEKYTEKELEVTDIIEKVKI